MPELAIFFLSDLDESHLFPVDESEGAAGALVTTLPVVDQAKGYHSVRIDDGDILQHDAGRTRRNP
ncbi:MAG: hypothetical protein R2856_29530 [Caldilineaceae bacterium]